MHGPEVSFPQHRHGCVYSSINKVVVFFFCHCMRCCPGHLRAADQRRPPFTKNLIGLGTDAHLSYRQTVLLMYHTVRGRSPSGNHGLTHWSTSYGRDTLLQLVCFGDVAQNLHCLERCSFLFSRRLSFRTFR